MSAKDISRFLFQPQKHYSSVRMQQGRVILDSDWNESERIDDEEARRTLLDIICARGTPNGGFRVTGVAPGTEQVSDAPTYDFEIGEGSFYVGGLRFEQDREDERFLEQRDWLRIDVDATNLPSAPSPADLEAGQRFDLVYLRAWEQCVTAVEDSELRERGLGGPDTSVRMRRMRRVEVLPDTAESCPEAFQQLVEELTAPLPPDQSGDPHTFDGAASELASKAKLTVAPAAEGISDDPCSPAVEAGFLGAENQTIRVELTTTDRFIWGIDNAAPYYRVQVLQESGQPVRIQFLTLPPDQRAQPLQGQAVEIHPWGAILSNDEKVAELRGHLATVESSYDPESRSLTISEPVPQAWLDWLDDPDHADYLSERDEDGQQKYFYLRLWTGGSGDGAEPDHAFTPGTPVELAGTGLTVSFSDHGLPGDHWIIAARPHTPGLVVAWELMEEAPPAGTRVFFAPLAVIHWSIAADPNGEETVEPSVHDCRGRFRPLCDVRGCCTVAVGDGRVSRGHFQSIQDAVDALPAEGGEVCVLPGVHQARVTVAGRRKIRIHGCGSQTLIIPTLEDRSAPLFRILDSERIALERMEMATLEGTAVVVTAGEENGSREIEVAYNRILAFQQAIRIETARDVSIHHNRIRMLDRDGAGVGILIRAEDALIERNEIGVVPPGRTPPDDGPGPDGDPDPSDPCEDPERFYGHLPFLIRYLSFVFQPLILVVIDLVRPFRALAGIQIAAGAERVRVLENQIIGGAGHGITLGGGAAIVETPAEDDAPEILLEHGDRQLWGEVAGPGGPLKDVGVLFRRTDGSGTVTAHTDATGSFLVPAEPATYAVSIASPGYRLEGVSTDHLGEFGAFHRLRVSDAVAQPTDLLAFLYEIRIDGNRIARMGLCGIGIPRPVPRQPGRTLSQSGAAVSALQAVLGNPVVGLGVDRNHIHDCLQAPFDDRLRQEAQTRAFGGISLGLCEDVVISGNRIEDNGTTHVNPVCGIFITFGERVTIRDNEIAGNGPVRPVFGTVAGGQRGGIVLVAASFGFDDLLGGRDAPLDTGRYAARIHDNVVWQPVGQALRLFALGPVSISHNRLHSGDAGPESIELLAGAVLVLNAGGAARLPAGITLFEANQTRLGENADTLTSQLIWTFDDLGYYDNQSHALTDGRRLTDNISMLVHAYLVSPTVRATDSRFKEPGGRTESAFKVSLLSLSSALNNTTNNQGDHCIFATNTAPGRPAVTAGNQVIDTTFCSPLTGVVTNATTTFVVKSRI